MTQDKEEADFGFLCSKSDHELGNEIIEWQHRDPGGVTHGQCHDPSHGGFYMAEGAFYIRIRLPPRVVSGDCLASSLYGLIDRNLRFLHAHVRCLMSSDLGVVLVCFIYLMIMRVGARSHGTLYPMMGCVLYLDGLLC